MSAAIFPKSGDLLTEAVTHVAGGEWPANDWKTLQYFDLNLWRDDQGANRLTAYLIVDGETFTDAGIEIPVSETQARLRADLADAKSERAAYGDKMTALLGEKEAEIEVLRAQITQDAVEIKHLKAYTRHHTGCPAADRSMKDDRGRVPRYRCTCGLFSSRDVLRWAEKVKRGRKA